LAAKPESIEGIVDKATVETIKMKTFTISHD